MRLESFVVNDDYADQYVFPLAAVTDRLGDVEAAADFLVTPRGGYDTGDAEAGDRPALLTKSLTLYDTTPEALQPQLDALRRLRGKRGTLWATTYTGEQRRLRNVRCKQVQYDRTNRNFQWQPVTIFFEAPNQRWEGDSHETWLLDDGEYLDTGLYLDDNEYTFTLASVTTNCVVENGGNATQHNVVLRIVGGSATAGSYLVSCGDAEFEYTGLIGLGDELVIDCGAQHVTDDGSAVYGAFALTANHAIEEWLALAPGENTITVTRTGGADSILTVTFRDAWA